MELICRILVAYLLLVYGGKILKGCIGFLAGIIIFAIAMSIILFIGKVLLTIILIVLAIAAVSSIFR